MNMGRLPTLTIPASIFSFFFTFFGAARARFFSRPYPNAP